MKDMAKYILGGIGMLIFVVLLFRYGKQVAGIIEALAKATTGTISTFVNAPAASD